MTKTRISVSIVLAAIAAAVVVAVVGAGPAEAAFPGQNGKIAFGRGGFTTTVSADIWTVNPDGTGAVNLTNDGISPLDSEPDFSPDGAKIAFVRGANTAAEIYVMDSDGTNETRLTNDSTEDTDPVFSPDGTKIAFTSERDTSSGGIYVMDSDGTNPTGLAFDGSKEPDFSPDGTKIAFTRSGQLYVINSDGSNMTPLTSSEVANGISHIEPDFSPDGTKIVFRRDFGGQDDRIATIRADGTGRDDVTEGNLAHDKTPDWQPLSFELSLRVSDGPDPARVGQDLTYSLAVHNAGPSVATNVSLTDRLPSGVGFVSASQGCTNTSGTVRCSLGDIAPGTTTTVEIVVRPTAEGMLSNTASISSVPRDPGPENNSDTEATEVAPNRTPVANSDAYSVDEDGTLTVNAPGLLSDDTDADRDALSVADSDSTAPGIQPASGPSDGVLDLNADGSFSYAPNANFDGTDSFAYRATDGSAESSVATVLIRVLPVQDPPQANDDTATTEKDTAKTVPVLSNDGDVDGDALSVSSVSDPAHGTATVNPDGTVRYAPDAGYVGADPFTYTVSDGNGTTDTATVNVTVTDTVKPTVSRVVPAENLTGVAPGTNVSAFFSEPMMAASIKGTTFKLYRVNPDRTTTPITDVTVTLSSDGLTATLNPFGKSTTLLAKNTKYKAIVTTGARDLAGNKLAANKTWYFTVKP